MTRNFDAITSRMDKYAVRLDHITQKAMTVREFRRTIFVSMGVSATFLTVVSVIVFRIAGVFSG